MGFQRQINTKQPYGVPGEMHDSSVKRVTAYDCATAVKVGNPAYRVSTGASQGKVTDTFATGTAAEYVGVIVNPKEYVIESGSLEATLVIPKQSIAQVASIGHINVVVCESVKAGDSAYYKAASGWCKTAPTAGNTQDGSVLGKFICDGATGEVVTVAVNVNA